MNNGDLSYINKRDPIIPFASQNPEINDITVEEKKKNETELVTKAFNTLGSLGPNALNKIHPFLKKVFVAIQAQKNNSTNESTSPFSDCVSKVIREAYKVTGPDQQSMPGDPESHLQSMFRLWVGNPESEDLTLKLQKELHLHDIVNEIVDILAKHISVERDVEAADPLPMDRLSKLFKKNELFQNLLWGSGFLSILPPLLKKMHPSELGQLLILPDKDGKTLMHNSEIVSDLIPTIKELPHEVQLQILASLPNSTIQGDGHDRIIIDLIPLITTLSDKEQEPLNQKLVNIFVNLLKNCSHELDENPSIIGIFRLCMPWLKVLPFPQLIEIFKIKSRFGNPLMHSPWVVEMLFFSKKVTVPDIDSDTEVFSDSEQDEFWAINSDTESELESNISEDSSQKKSSEDWDALNFETAINLLTILNEDGETPLHGDDSRDLNVILSDAMHDPEKIAVLKRLSKGGDGDPIPMLFYGAYLISNPFQTDDDQLEAMKYFEKAVAKGCLDLLRKIDLLDENNERLDFLDLAFLNVVENLPPEEQEFALQGRGPEEIVATYTKYLEKGHMVNVILKMAQDGKLLPMMAIAKSYGIEIKDDEIEALLDGKKSVKASLDEVLSKIPCDKLPMAMLPLATVEISRTGVIGSEENTNTMPLTEEGQFVKETLLNRIKVVVARQLINPTETPLFESTVDSAKAFQSTQKQLRSWIDMTSNLIKSVSESKAGLSEENGKLISQNLQINALLFASLNSIAYSREKAKNSTFKLVYDKEGNVQAATLFKTGEKRRSANNGPVVSIPFYVCLISTAPWNLRVDATSQDKRRVEGAATALIESAIYESIKNGSKGAVALEAVPLAVEFYKKLGFEISKWTPSGGYPMLPMELSIEAAQDFLKSARAGRAMSEGVKQ